MRTYCVLRPPLWRTLVTAPSSQAPLRVAAARRASPLQSGAVALGEQQGASLGAPSESVCVPTAPRGMALTATRPCILTLMTARRLPGYYTNTTRKRNFSPLPRVAR